MPISEKVPVLSRGISGKFPWSPLVTNIGWASWKIPREILFWIITCFSPWMRAISIPPKQLHFVYSFIKLLYNSKRRGNMCAHSGSSWNSKSFSSGMVDMFRVWNLKSVNNYVHVCLCSVASDSLWPHGL